jgi:hypothetical protein
MAPLAATVLFAGVLVAAGAHAQPAPCAGLQKHLNRMTGLRSFMVKEGDAVDGRRAIADVDVDGDGTAERIVVTRPPPSDRFPPETSAVSIVLSGSQTELRIEFQRLYLIRYERVVYLVGSRLLDPEGPVQTDVLRVDRTGFVPACRYVCNLRGGCRPRDGREMEGSEGGTAAAGK